MIAGLFAALALLAQLGDFSGYPELARFRDQPRDVRVHIDRRMNCDHWLGEEPYDKARRREINAAVRHLQCARLEADEARLRRRHHATPQVLEALDAAQAGLW